MQLPRCLVHPGQVIIGAGRLESRSPQCFRWSVCLPPWLPFGVAGVACRRRLVFCRFPAVSKRFRIGATVQTPTHPSGTVAISADCPYRIFCYMPNTVVVLLLTMVPAAAASSCCTRPSFSSSHPTMCFCLLGERQERFRRVRRVLHPRGGHRTGDGGGQQKRERRPPGGEVSKHPPTLPPRSRSASGGLDSFFLP